ncbi:MAG: DUF547 domain-containing protein [Anaerolineae bacterium]
MAQTISSSYVRWPQRLYRAINLIAGDEVLNNDKNGGGAVPDDLAANIFRLARRIESEHVNRGRPVNYADLHKSEAFGEFQILVQLLKGFDLDTLATSHDSKAFWINLYNALIIHAVIVLQPKAKVSSIRGFFEKAAYNVGGLRYSANDIEHGVLRKNAGHPLIPGPQFGKRDPRCANIVATLDPRVHFALNCAAKSCPPLNFYSPELLDRQLDLATRNFVSSGGLVIHRSMNTIYLSPLFSWYASDFGASLFGYRHKEKLITYVIQYIENEEDQEFLRHSNQEQKLKVRFQEYDWSLNE